MNPGRRSQSLISRSNTLQAAQKTARMHPIDNPIPRGKNGVGSGLFSAAASCSRLPNPVPGFAEINRQLNFQGARVVIRQRAIEFV
jgi:hypothetical protein